MHIKINEDYNVVVNTAVLGYVGETNARPVTFEGLTVDGADRYVLTIDYGDGVTYEVDITGGQWTPTADILRSAQTVSCQICAKKLSGDEYILVKKSRIFRLRIGAAIGDNAVPSPSVAADALDRISAIGEQVEADVERAENAASTAMQAAENAKKSATTAEKSADTATQAASRAETAKASAETSATQAETAMQGAETARAEAVTSQNAAKISAAQAATSAQQTTADKNITSGYAKTAKTCADSTAADRQAVQTLAEQVTADKANVAENATKVAEDRVAAETAAQKAQSIADSLPDDYVTAVGKIAENTAEIANVKLTDKELTRRVDALFDMGQGVTHKFETDTDTAYTKIVPTGAKLMSVKSVGGHSEVIDGEIVSAATEEVVEQGANLCDPTIFAATYPDCISVKDDIIDIISGKTAMFESGVALKIPQGYRMTVIPVSKENGAINGRIRALFSDGNIRDIYITDGNGLPKSATNYVVEKDISAIAFNWSAIGGGYSFKMQITRNATDSFTPYHSTAHKISEAIRNLPGYGWSAGTAKNYVDYENKKYYQCVGSVDLGTLNWKFNTTSSVGNHFYALADHLNFKYLGEFGSTIYNALCSKYRTVARNSHVFVDKTLAIDGVDDIVSQIQIKDTAYTDAATFKQAMQGVILYYELANPIVTDISTLIDDDFLRNVEVEAGGSVTFKGGNDDYRIPVPSEEEYVVKLSEVGGTT